MFKFIGGDNTQRGQSLKVEILRHVLKFGGVDADDGWRVPETERALDPLQGKEVNLRLRKLLNHHCSVQDLAARNLVEIRSGLNGVRAVSAYFRNILVLVVCDGSAKRQRTFGSDSANKCRNGDCSSFHGDY